MGAPNNGTGSFTYYYFGQGTGKDSSGNYLTACGYRGSEPSGANSDTVQHIASTGLADSGYFAAIPGHNGFDTKTDCGACVQITNGSKSIIATIIDECPYDGGQNGPCGADPTGHLDLSKKAIDALGYSVGNPSNTTWKFVPCPVSGNVFVRIKSGNNDEIYIENEVLPLKTVKMGGVTATMTSYGTWKFGTAIGANAQLTLTDTSNRTITITIKSTTPDQDQDTGSQFPACN